MPEELAKQLEEEVKKKLEEEEKRQQRQLLPIFEFKNVGDTLIGKVLAIRTVNTKVGQRKLMEIHTSNGDYAIWLSHKVLEEELRRKDVREGDFIGIKFLGKPEGKSYYAYVVVKL